MVKHKAEELCGQPAKVAKHELPAEQESIMNHSCIHHLWVCEGMIGQ
jgi:hypothetical protein